jgi:hypothetical protein
MRAILGECPARHRGLPLQSILIRRARTAHRKAPEHAFKHQGRALLSYAPESLRKGKENFSTRCFEKDWRIDEALNKYADESLTQPKGLPMLWTIIVILVVLWLLGLIGHVGGSLIHLLLVVAVIVLIINLIQGRRGL